MPFPNEHAARQVDPSKFKSFNRVSGTDRGFPAGIDIIFGITADGKSEIQSLRFDKDKWTPSRAKEWLASHEEFNSGNFEEATGVEKSGLDDTDPADVLIWAALGFHVVDPATVAPVQVQVLKANDELMEVTGVVLAAGEEDAQGDIISADEIRKAMRNYLLNNGMTVGLRHKEELKQADVVEIYQAPVAFEMNGQAVKVGDWVMTTNFSKVPEIWAEIKAGNLNAYSVGGFGERTPL